MCRKQSGIAIGRLCDKCDGKCPVCDSYVRPTTLVRICDECSFGNYQNKCVVCGGEGISDAFYCFECTRLEKDRDGCPKIINLGSSRTDLFCGCALLSAGGTGRGASDGRANTVARSKKKLSESLMRRRTTSSSSSSSSSSYRRRQPARLRPSFTSPTCVLYNKRSLKFSFRFSATTYTMHLQFGLAFILHYCTSMTAALIAMCCMAFKRVKRHAASHTLDRSNPYFFPSMIDASRVQVGELIMIRTNTKQRRKKTKQNSHSHAPNPHRSSPDLKRERRKVYITTKRNAKGKRNDGRKGEQLLPQARKTEKTPPRSRQKKK